MATALLGIMGLFEMCCRATARATKATRVHDGIYKINLRVSPDDRSDLTIKKIEGKDGSMIYSPTESAKKLGLIYEPHVEARSVVSVDWFIPRDGGAKVFEIFLSSSQSDETLCQLSLSMRCKHLPWHHNKKVVINNIKHEKQISA
jgi:hypothetical protein